MAADSSLRSIEVPPPVAPRRMFGRPILEPISGHAWESHVVLNPAAVLIDDLAELLALTGIWGLSDSERTRLVRSGGACVMLYRAQGERDEERGVAPSSIGMAIFTPELELVSRRPEPVLLPDAPYHDLGVEDPRCTRVGDRFYLYYTGYGRNGGSEGRVQICLATTSDFVSWEVLGPVAGDLNLYPNKNPALLSERVNGRWLMLHRPMEGPDAMTIHLAEAPEPSGPWTSLGPLMKSYRYLEFSRSWIGAGGPPISLGDGRFLMIYHQGHFTVDERREYDLAAALLDFRHEDPVRARIEPLMRPSGALEVSGDAELGVDNVLFTCANYRFGDRVIIPYAGADSRIFGAWVDLGSIVAALEKHATAVESAY
ncbi:MAG TPA: glycosidase [Rhodothermales bacterium]